jgi:hypothetical protein
MRNQRTCWIEITAGTVGAVLHQAMALMLGLAGV